MLIQVADRVLNDTLWHPVLDVIASLLERNGNRHFFDPLQHSKLIRSTWLIGAQGQRALLAATLAASAKSVVQQGASDAVTVELDISASEVGETCGSKIRIHPFGALFLLTQPFHIVVEDESSDGGFLLWVARALGIDAISRAYKSGALTFRHAGGKGQMSKSASALSYGVWPRDTQPIRSMRLRVAAVLDSDAKYPADAPNADISAAVAPHVAFVHILGRRTIENYVADRVLRVRMGNGERARVDAYCRLTDPQRRHFPMKRGFRSEAGAPLSFADYKLEPNRPAQEVALYAGVAAGDWPLLNTGFGDGISAVFTEARYRCAPNTTGLFDHTDTLELGNLLRRVVRHL